MQNFENLRRISNDFLTQFYLLMLIGSCNKNQTCIKVQECQHTKNMLEELRTTNDVKEKEKLINSMKTLICGSPTDKTVCCDIDNG